MVACATPAAAAKSRLNFPGVLNFLPRTSCSVQMECGEMKSSLPTEGE